MLCLQAQLVSASLHFTEPMGDTSQATEAGTGGLLRTTRAYVDLRTCFEDDVSPLGDAFTRGLTPFVREISRRLSELKSPSAIGLIFGSLRSNLIPAPYSSAIVLAIHLLSDKRHEVCRVCLNRKHTPPDL